MVLQTSPSAQFELTLSSQKMSQLLTEIRFLLEHSVEVRKVSVKQYFSLLMAFNQQAAAKNLKDYYLTGGKSLEKEQQKRHEAVLDICLQVLNDYQTTYMDASEPLLWRILDHILRKLSMNTICGNCYGWRVSTLPSIHKFSTSFSHPRFYCEQCKKSVEIYQKFELFPSILDYFMNLSRNTKNYRKIKTYLLKSNLFSFLKISKRHQNLLVLFYNLFQDLYSYALKKANIQAAYSLWILSRRINYPTTSLNPPLESYISNYLNDKIEISDFSDYAMCLDLLQKIYPLQQSSVKKFYLAGGIEKNIIRALSKGNVEKFKHSYNFGVNNQLILPQEFIKLPHFEAACIRGLYYALETEDLDRFERFYNFLLSMGLAINTHDIPNRITLMLELIQKSIKIRRIDHIFTLFQFGIDYDLYYLGLNKNQKSLIQNLRRNTVLMDNIQDLFSFTSRRQLDSFLYFLYLIMPSEIFAFFETALQFLPFPEDIFGYLKDFLDNYCIYGLTLKKIGTRAHFFQKMKPLLENSATYPDEVDVEYAHRHLIVSIENLKHLDQLLSQKKPKFQFPLVGMVIKGGLGPEGYGFAYMTPRGELIEICSDLKQNHAYIVEFKKFLKSEFIRELNSHINGLGLNLWQQQKLNEILEGHLQQDQSISIYLEQHLFEEIRGFLEDEFDFNRITKHEQDHLYSEIKLKIHAILMPITLIDQYRCRLDLLHQGKIHAAEIAKITALEDISHYDLLRERYFYQSLLLAMRRHIKNQDI